MKRTSLGTILLAAVAIGCSDSTGPAETTDLVGTWNASAFVFTNSADAAQTVDVIALGMTLSITFTETTMSGIMSFPGEGQELFSGTYTLSGGQITFLDSDPEEGDETFTQSLDGSILTLTFSDSFDFNDDGQETDATAVMTLTKV